jgi:DNA-binding MarR family transcriptional regulator
MSKEAEELTAKDIEETLQLLCSDKVAIRIMLRPKEGQERGKVKEGVFDNYEDAAKALAQYDRKADIYFTINPVYSPKKGYTINVLQDAIAGGSITDKDIIARRWMLIDIDSKHPKDIPATETEWLEALKLANVVKAYLKAQEFPDPIVASSGNGVHLLYRVDLPNDPESHDILRRCLGALADKFKQYDASVDRSVHNASRIIRLYGTQNIKGIEEEGRPHRLSYIKQVPSDGPKVVPTDVLVKLGGEASEAVKKISTRNLTVAKTIKHGERNPAMTQIAGRLRRAGLTPEEIFEVLMRQNQELCESPLPEHEIRIIVRSATGWDQGPYEEDIKIGDALEEDIHPTQVKAMELLKSGQFIAFCKRIVDRYHKFDDSLKVLMLYNLPRAGYTSPSINLFHLDFTGQPGTGKNSIIVKMAYLLPEENAIVLNSVSDKALYYKTREEIETTDDKGKIHRETSANPYAFEGKLLAITEVTSGGVTALKAATEIDEKAVMVHSTVADSKYIELTLKGRRVVWTSSVEGTQDRQALDRCWHASVSENTDVNRSAKILIASQNVSNVTSIYSDPDVEIARAGWKILLSLGDVDDQNLEDNGGKKRHCLKETEEFQEALLEALVIRGYETRNLLQFMALCKNIAIVKSFKRGHTSYTIEDVREAWFLLKEFQPETISKLTFPEIRLLEKLQEMNDQYIRPRQTDLAKSVKINPSQITRALSRKEESPGKLLELGYVVYEYDDDKRAIVHDITPLGRLMLDKHEDLFVWNGMVYVPKDPMNPVDAFPPRPVTENDRLMEMAETGKVYSEGALQQYAEAMMRQVVMLRSSRVIYRYNSLKEKIVSKIKEEHDDWPMERILSTYDHLVKHDETVSSAIQEMVSDFPFLGFGTDEV